MDLMGFDLNDREIVLVDHDDNNFVMMKCAKDSESFIEVLHLYIDYVFKKISKKNMDEFQSLNKIYQVAGGSAYKKFVDFLFS